MRGDLTVKSVSMTSRTTIRLSRAQIGALIIGAAALLLAVRPMPSPAAQLRDTPASVVSPTATDPSQPLFWSGRPH
jgi:hypothetical protein